MQEVFASINSALLSVGKGVVTVATRAGEASAAIGGLTGNVRSASEVIRTSEVPVAALVDRLAQLAQLTGQVNETSKVMQGLMHHFTKLSSGSAEVGGALDGLAENVRRTRETATGVSEAMGMFSSGTGRATQSMENLGAVFKTLGVGSERLVEAVSLTQRLFAEILEANKNLSKQLTEGIELTTGYHQSLRAIRDDLRADLLASEDAVRKVHKNLIEATRIITSQVK